MQAMWNKISFINNWHNGDIHVSRSFVKYIVANTKATYYEYQHTNSPRLLLDIPELCIVQPYTLAKDSKIPYIIDGKDLFINTWYAASPTFDQHGMHFEALYSLFQLVFDEVFKWDINSLDKRNLLPDIDFAYYAVDAARAYFVESSQDSRWRKKVFCSNGPYLSYQGLDFSINNVVRTYAQENPDILFLFTEDVDNTLDNMITTRSIIGLDDNDLNENAYVAQFCDVLLGQSSGPHTFAHTKVNLMDATKTFVILTTIASCGQWASFEGRMCEFLWVPSVDKIDSVMKKVLA